MTPIEAKLLQSIGNFEYPYRIRPLITACENLNVTNEAGETPLILAIKIESYSITPDLIKAGADVNLPLPNGRTPLMLAARQLPRTKKLRLLDMLLTANADVNAVDEDGDTAFHHAASYLARIKLVKAGLNVNAANVDGVTPLMLAAKSGSIRLVKELLARGANPIATDIYNHNALDYLKRFVRGRKLTTITGLLRRTMMKYDKAPLVTALLTNRKIAKKLIKEGIGINAADENGVTPIMVAAHLKDGSILRQLLAVGSNLDMKDNQGNDVFYYAREPRILKALQQHRAIGKASPKTIETPMTFALLHEPYIVTTLIADGQYINTPNSDGVTPLMIAAMQGKSVVVKELLTAGADLFAKDKNGKTAFDYAKDQNPTLKVLRTAANQLKETPLTYALLCRPEWVKRLIRAGVDVNQPNLYGITPLIIAAKQGKKEFVRLLLNAGADINKADKHGRTIWTYAAEYPIIAETLAAVRTEPGQKITGKPVVFKKSKSTIKTRDA